MQTSVHLLFLIVVYSNDIEITTAEFKTRADCESAKSVIVKEIQKLNPGNTKRLEVGAKCILTEA